MTSYVAQAHPHPNPNPRYSKNASSLSPIGTEINGAFQNRFSTDPMANGFSAIGSFKERIRKLHDSEDDKNQLIEVSSLIIFDSAVSTESERSRICSIDFSTSRANTGNPCSTMIARNAIIEMVNCASENIKPG